MSRMKEQMLQILADTNPFNKKAKTEELDELLGSYVPAAEALRTKLKKYDRLYKELTEENAELEKKLEIVDNRRREKISKQVKYAGMEQELRDLHALVDSIPPEIVEAYSRTERGRKESMIE